MNSSINLINSLCGKYKSDNKFTQFTNKADSNNSNENNTSFMQYNTAANIPVNTAQSDISSVENLKTFEQLLSNSVEAINNLETKNKLMEQMVQTKDKYNYLMNDGNPANDLMATMGYQIETMQLANFTSEQLIGQGINEEFIQNQMQSIKQGIFANTELDLITPEKQEVKEQLPAASKPDFFKGNYKIKNPGIADAVEKGLLRSSIKHF